MMEYKGYIGEVEFDDEAAIFHGSVINTRDVITFQGESVAELKKAFQESVEDYLSFCASRGEEPDKPFSGQFVTRIPPELHRQVNLAAKLSGKSLNAWVAEQLQSAVIRIGGPPSRGISTAASEQQDEEHQVDCFCSTCQQERTTKLQALRHAAKQGFDEIDQGKASSSKARKRLSARKP